MKYIKQKSNKNIISDCLADLRKWDYKVFNFNQKNRFGRGLVGFTDYLIIGKGMLVFVECKIGKDKFSDEQLGTRKSILYAAERNPFIFYCTITENNYSDFFTDVTMKNIKNLKVKYL